MISHLGSKQGQEYIKIQLFRSIMCFVHFWCMISPKVLTAASIQWLDGPKKRVLEYCVAEMLHLAVNLDKIPLYVENKSILNLKSWLSHLWRASSLRQRVNSHAPHRLIHQTLRSFGWGFKNAIVGKHPYLQIAESKQTARRKRKQKKRKQQRKVNEHHTSPLPPKKKTKGEVNQTSKGSARFRRCLHLSFESGRHRLAIIRPAAHALQLPDS